MTNRLREALVGDVGSVRKVYSTLERCEVAMPVSDVQKSIIGMFNCRYLGESEYLKSIGIK